MYVIFLAGGIASGKSTVARVLEERGAWRVDLDQISRSVLLPDSPCLDEVAVAFGHDLVDTETGELDRGLLAKRAFADAESAALLEDIELPYIRDALVRTLAGEACAATEPVLCVVEVPLLDRMETMLDLADEVVCVTCPHEVRRERAIGRGMDADDFERRAANQPTEEYLRAHADAALDNSGDEEGLLAALDAWWDAHERTGWTPSRAEGR